MKTNGAERGNERVAEQTVSEHYSYDQSGLWERLESALISNGKDPDHLIPSPSV